MRDRSRRPPATWQDPPRDQQLLATERGMPAASGSGLFARAIMDHFPHLPVEEEGRLHDPNLRENFVEHIFVMQRWRELQTPQTGMGVWWRSTPATNCC